MCRCLTIVMVGGMVLACFAVAEAVTIETVPVGNIGNANDGTGFGGVAYTYNVGKYEVTAGQYAEFLNAVATTDTYSLYNADMWNAARGCKIQQSGSPGSYTYSVASGYADRPVNFVSWGDSARFANWLHNGQPTGAQSLTTTEDGAYFLNGATSAAALLAVTREVDWTWALTSEDEWYKAAYHKNDGVTGNYWDYPTNSDILPSNALINPDPGNNATFYNNGYTGGIDGTTVVGEHENSESPYGTFDQGGNLREWNEAIIGSNRGLRGGVFNGLSSLLAASYRDESLPTNEWANFGIRVVQVPEPATMVMFSLACMGILRRPRP